MINYSMIYLEINILQWLSDKSQVSILQHWKIAIDVNKDFNYFERKWTILFPKKFECENNAMFLFV